MTTPTHSEGFAHAPAAIRLGDLEVRRLGYGAMRLPGKEVWGEPDDPARARQVLRRANTPTSPKASRLEWRIIAA